MDIPTGRIQRGMRVATAGVEAGSSLHTLRCWHWMLLAKRILYNNKYYSLLVAMHTDSHSACACLLVCCLARLYLP